MADSRRRTIGPKTIPDSTGLGSARRIATGEKALQTKRKEAAAARRTNVGITIAGMTGLESAQKAIAVAIFGEQNIADLNKNGIKTRAIYETSSCDTQCNRVIGGVTDGTKCWICDLPIFNRAKRAIRTADGKATNLLVHVEPGQCEHVLPIIQAVMYLALYTGKHDLKDEAYKNFLKLEYEWAHEKCNLLKNDDVYIKTVGDRYEVDTDKIRVLLNNVWGTMPDYTYASSYTDYLQTAYGDKKGFVDHCLAQMMGRLTQITDHLNAKGAPGLVQLAAAVALRHSVTAKAAELLKNGGDGGAPLVLPEPKQMYQAILAYVKDILEETNVKGAAAVLRDLIKDEGLKDAILGVFLNLQTNTYKSSGAPYTTTDRKTVDCLYERAKVDCIRWTLEMIMAKMRREKDVRLLAVRRDALVAPDCGLEDWYTKTIRIRRTREEVCKVDDDVAELAAEAAEHEKDMDLANAMAFLGILKGLEMGLEEEGMAVKGMLGLWRVNEGGAGAGAGAGAAAAASSSSAWRGGRNKTKRRKRHTRQKTLRNR